MRALAEAGEAEGSWLRADRQTGGKGRRGRTWVSPDGNLHASTLVRLREGDPPAPTLALVAAVVMHEVVSAIVSPPCKGGDQGVGFSRLAPSSPEKRQSRETHPQPLPCREGGLLIKWPNDLLLDGKKLAGILLERADAAVIIGFGVNLAHAPTNLDRSATSLAVHAPAPTPDIFVGALADVFAQWVAAWRDEGLPGICSAWLDRAHSIATALSVDAGDGNQLHGAFDGLTPEGALILRLENARTHIIHAGDVFLFEA